MIKLRKFTNDDISEISLLLNDDQVSRWTSNIPYPYSEKDAEAWLSETEKIDRYPCAIEFNDELVGCVSHWPHSKASVEVGYWVGRKYWGQGIGSKALSLFMKKDSFPQCNKVVAKIMEGNIGSEKVLLNNGFNFIEKCIVVKSGKKIDARYFERPIPVE